MNRKELINKIIIIMIVSFLFSLLQGCLTTSSNDLDREYRRDRKHREEPYTPHSRDFGR